VIFGKTVYLLKWGMMGKKKNEIEIDGWLAMACHIVGVKCRKRGKKFFVSEEYLNNSRDKVVQIKEFYYYCQTGY